MLATAWTWSGVETTTASMSLCVSSILRKSRCFLALGKLAKVPAALRWSTSQRATMFSVPSLWSWAMFPPPWPPEPIAAMFSRWLGGVWPGPPRTCRGTMVSVAAAATVAVRKSRRDTPLRARCVFIRAISMLLGNQDSRRGSWHFRRTAYPTGRPLASFSPVSRRFSRRRLRTWSGRRCGIPITSAANPARSASARSPTATPLRLPSPLEGTPPSSAAMAFGLPAPYNWRG